jgi:hypothetical protein
MVFINIYGKSNLSKFDHLGNRTPHADHSIKKRQRETRRKIIRQWMRLSKDKRQSVNELATFAKAAAEQNANAFAHSRRNPHEKIMGWLLPRAHRGA